MTDKFTPPLTGEATRRFAEAEEQRAAARRRPNDPTEPQAKAQVEDTGAALHPALIEADIPGLLRAMEAYDVAIEQLQRAGAQAKAALMRADADMRLKLEIDAAALAEAISFLRETRDAKERKAVQAVRQAVLEQMLAQIDAYLAEPASPAPDAGGQA